MTTNTSYKPLNIQSDYSVSNARREIYLQSLQEKLKKSWRGWLCRMVSPS
ncbi:hypothetical protein [Helicobacter mesocricetorum]|nr:hypothetical protein [Helicobacter mesocricetorum]